MRSATAPLCITVMGEHTKADVVSKRLGDGDKFTVEGLALDVIIIYAPGHTDDSYSFVMPDGAFTGDTLLIRGTSRTTTGLNVRFLSVDITMGQVGNSTRNAFSERRSA
jgi:glyoxylase-like metal-dependent hydrolase (beta-lactamase superfamily II)